MNKTILCFCILLSFLSACNKEDLRMVEEFSDPDYPTRYCFLSDAERNALSENFNSDLKMYFEVDSFGYLDTKSGQNLNSEMFSGQINSKDSVLHRVKVFIHNNRQLYGVNDPSLMKVGEIKSYWVSYDGSLVKESEADRNRWFIKYEDQIYDNIEVYNSQIGFYISPNGVYQSFGHWYADIHLPKYEDVTLEDAKEDLIGKTFTWIGMAGGVEHTLTADDFYGNEEPAKIIIPFRKEDCFEMRLCWKIHSHIWYFYVDVLSGEIVLKEQTFIS